MSVRILHGDCRDVLPTLPAEAFDCIVTSPPYWGLRDYGTAKWEGGDAVCVHSVGGQVQQTKAPGAITSGVRPGADASRCRKCGARRIDQQIGLEPTLDAYVETMVGVFREVRRVLKPSGICWLNLGDCYAATSRSAGARTELSGLKPKDLCMVPHRVALALQADGWWVRSAVVWHKHNPMPESVVDRPTGAYEMVFLLTKSASYFYDAEAIAEDAARAGDWNCANPPTDAPYAMTRRHQVGPTRNARNVWTIATQPFKGSHFATMPPDLAERCIKAGSSERGCCPACGKPWERVRGEAVPTGRGAGNGFARPERVSVGGRGDETVWVPKSRETIAWRPTCDCPAHDPIPAKILDPFGGSGTTGLVADRLGRDATLIELNPAYRGMGADRISNDAPLFAEVTA